MKIIISEKQVKVVNKELLMSGNVNTYLIDVEYSDVYKDRVLNLYFKNGDIKKIEQVGPNNVVKIPHEVLNTPGILFIGVFSSNLSDNILVDRYCSNLDTLEIREGAYDKDATYTEELTPSILEQYLQEMKDFYLESINEYNENVIAETDKFNTNADNRKKEIDAVALNIEEDKKAVEKIQEKVELSEQNAKESADNAKTSEQEAQNSANKVIEIETSVTGIQTDINSSKAHIDDQKENVDKSVENAEKLVDEATNQARISREQAELSTTNAGQVTADKIVVENMKNEVSAMKTSVEQTKADAEQIKEETEQAKNETLEAKTEVENSLENERIESDKKYARAIESEEIVIDGDGQVELDEDGYMKELYAEANLPDITQENRLGYNLLKTSAKTNTQNGVDYIVNENGSVNLNGEASEIIWINLNPNFNFETDDYTAFINENTINGVSLYSDAIGFCENIKTFNISEDISKSVLIRISKGTILNDVTVYPMILKGTYTKENIPEFESYGLSPSLEFPSEFQNVVKNVEMKLLKNNLSNFTTESTGAILGTSWVGLDFEIINNYTSKISGKPTVDEYRVGGPYNSTNVLIPIDYKKNYYIYNNLNLRMGVTLVQKDGTYRQLSLDNKELLSLTENDIGISSLRISVNTKIEYKNTILRYIVCEAIEENELALSEDQFLGTFQGFKNYIKDNKLLKSLVKVKLNGTEDWELKNVKEKTQVFFLNLQKKIVPNIGFCNYLKFNAPGDVEKYTPVEGGIYIAINKSTASTVEELKNLLSSLYNSGNAMTFIYAIPTPEKEDLSTENKTVLNSLKVYKGINNIYSNCKIRFKANKNVQKELDKCVKNTDYATNNKVGLIKGRATHGFNIDSLGAPYLSTYDEEYKDLPNSSFVSTGTLRKFEDRIKKESDNKHSKTLKAKVEDTNFAQIYADNPKIKNLVIKGEQLKQKIRQGYNLLDMTNAKGGSWAGITVTVNNDGTYNYVGIASEVAINVWLLGGYNKTEPIFKLKAGTYRVKDVALFYGIESIVPDVNGIVKLQIDIDITGVRASQAIKGKTYNEIKYPMIVKIEDKDMPYEQYGASPSLEYPSNPELLTEHFLQNTKENILYIDSPDYKPGYTITKDGITFTVQEDLGLKCVGTAIVNTAVDLISKHYNKRKLFVKSGTWYNYIVGNKTNGARITLHITKPGYLATRNDNFKCTEDSYVDHAYAEIVKGSEVDCIIYPQLTYEKVEKFIPFKGYTKTITLPEGKFNNAIGEYSDKILADDKQKKFIKELVLTGEENWSIAYPTITSEEFQSYMLNVESFVNTWLTGKGIMSNCFLNVMGDIVFYKTERGICSDDKGHLVICTNILNIEEFKTKLKELHEAGTPVKIYYATEDPKIIDLPEGTVPKIELMDGLNNISIDKGIMSFEYNKSLARAFEEEREEKEDLKTRVSNLENQILELLGGN